MNTNTDAHTCSYYCERPECVRRQRDELRDRMESAIAAPPSAPVGVDDALIAGAMAAAADACSRHVVCNEAIAAAVEYALAHQPAGMGVTATNSAVAAIQFALNDPEGMEFLRIWYEGGFDTLRSEWPDAPAEVYINADPLALQQQGGRDHG